MMFSRMAPTVLFTAFCVAVAGSYAAGERQSLNRPGTPDAAYIEAMNAFSDEMALALQVGDQARFRALLDAQVNAAGGLEGTAPFDRDILPAPFAELRQIAMRGTVEEMGQFLNAHPDISLNTGVGRYQSVPLFWATTNYADAKPIIELLLAAGADPKFKTANGYTLLHAMSSPFAFALDTPTVEAVIELLPEDVLHMRTTLGATPFVLALANGQEFVALAMLNKGADPNEPTPTRLPMELQPGEPPLVLAGANVELVEALLFAGADPLARDARGRPIPKAVAEAVKMAERALEERVAMSDAEEFDRTYAANYRKVLGMIQAAADARLAKGD